MVKLKSRGPGAGRVILTMGGWENARRFQASPGRRTGGALSGSGELLVCTVAKARGEASPQPLNPADRAVPLFSI